MPTHLIRSTISQSTPATDFLAGKMGIYLSSPKTEKESEDGGNGRLRYGLSSMQGWRTSMEDAHAAIPNLDNSTSFFAVYDGHGGKCVSRFCAKYLHQELLKDEAYKAGDLCTAIQRVFLRMDEVMCSQRAQVELREMEDKSRKASGTVGELLSPSKNGELDVEASGRAVEEGSPCDSDGPSAGSTACVAVIRENKLIVANAGDSRCIISRKGQAHDLSRDHKPELEEERERILTAGGFIQSGRVNGSLNLARAIGDMEFKQKKDLPPEKQMVTANPDVKTFDLCGDDEFLVLACDGIWDCMSSQQVVDFIHDQLKSESTLSNICHRVLDNCLAPSAGGEGCDNMTMVLVQLNKN